MVFKKSKHQKVEQAEKPVEAQESEISPAAMAAVGLLSDNASVPEDATRPAVETAVIAAEERKLVQDKPRPAYRVTAQKPNGFWAIKRKFLYKESVVLFADELSEEQIKNLEGKPPLALLVEKIEA